MDLIYILRKNIQDDGQGSSSYECLEIGYYGKSNRNKATVECVEGNVILKERLTAPPIYLNAENNFEVPKKCNWVVTKKKEFNGSFKLFGIKRVLSGDNIEIFQKYLISEKKVRESVIRALQELRIYKDLRELEGEELVKVMNLATSFLCVIKGKLLEEKIWFIEAQRYKRRLKESCLTVKQQNKNSQDDMPTVIMSELELSENVEEKKNGRPDK